MKNETVIIMGSSSSSGHTARISQHLAQNAGWEYIDLNRFDISYYDYHHENRLDDFIPLIKKILNQHKTIVFSTPVYWYSMSAIMKTFIDRLTDLLEIELPLKEQLKGMEMVLLSNSADKTLDYPFEIPFEKTAAYLEMKYLVHQHILNTEEHPKYQF